MSTQDCIARFKEDKQVLLLRYRFAFERSLARASFLTTEELIVLRAFVIFLVCLRRNHDPRVIWTLTGLVVRISQTLGIHRDGLHFGLPPFEVEMRRRLWWQVCDLDVRASEDHGCDPTIVEQAFDTKMPLHINDADIGPDTKEFPPARQGCTNMTLCLIRFEVANTFRRINFIPPCGPRTGWDENAAQAVMLQDKEKWITECHQRLEERYLQHCDMSVPLFWVTATVARLMVRWGATLPKETKDKLFITSLENIEYSLLHESEARTMKWGWVFRTYMQWHALAFMLSELCHRSAGDLVERAWVAVERTRDGRWGRPLTGDARAGHVWRPLRKLYRRAKEARQRSMAEEMLAKQGAVPTHIQRSVTRSGRQVTGLEPSNAQLQRFAAGPSYGEMPMDKHEWWLSQIATPGAVEDMDTADLPQRAMETTDQLTPGSQASLFDRMFSDPLHALTARAKHASEQPMSAPEKAKDRGECPQFPQQFMDGTGNVNFSLPADGVTRAADPASTAMGLLGMTASDPCISMRMYSIDSFEFDFDSGSMDTNGDVNWQILDEFVRQLGMDVNTTSDRRPGDMGINCAPNDGWNMAPRPNPSQANLRMGMGMGEGD
ncbi:hypothetical protein LTR53_013883 [Teratosphaeriaceae sp. CCFEE 6253]|nr:hypothetical protein LTR53_013883 [Teratosphaeriaceae sp. CCFEE 6253]